MLKETFIVVLMLFLVQLHGRLSSEEVILQLIKSKCVPVLIYGLEVCPSDLKALDFVVDRFFTKLFQTINMEVIRLAQQCLILCHIN